MIDLETMSSSPNAAIVSIGAVEFDPNTGKLYREFYQVVDLQSSIDAGLEVSGSTVMWWLKQSKEARDALQKDAFRLKDALASFTDWIDANSFVWAHGSNFDTPIMVSAYAKFGLEVPWKYKNVLDTRTVLWMTGNKMPSTGMGTAHNALDDAKNQAVAIMQFLRSPNE